MPAANNLIEDPFEAGTADANKPLSNSRKSAAKRNEIIRAAIEIINTKSYALAPMTEIAAALSLRDATLYYYFSSKRALGFACHVASLQRFERLLAIADQTGTTGAQKLTNFTRGLLVESARHGPSLYFGDYSYLEADQRETITDWALRLKNLLEQFLKDGIKDGSIVPCETALVIQLYLGMLIWLAKWVPSIEDMTVERLMNAIETFSIHGLQNRPPL